MPLSDAAKTRIPNDLTVLRLVLAAAFFAILSFSTADWAIVTSIGLFVVAALTDAADGHLARKWQVESTFGRIADPFADKVLVLGALIMLAGSGFRQDGPSGFQQVSGVYPWMVVVMLARELLVTAIRGVVESTGQKFGANVWGKLKMILQSVVVPACLLAVLLSRNGLDWAVQAAFVLMLVTVAVTVISGIPYVTGARRMLQAIDPTHPTDATSQTASSNTGAT